MEQSSQAHGGGKATVGPGQGARKGPKDRPMDGRKWRWEPVSDLELGSGLCRAFPVRDTTSRARCPEHNGPSTRPVQERLQHHLSTCVWPFPRQCSALTSLLSWVSLGWPHCLGLQPSQLPLHQKVRICSFFLPIPSSYAYDLSPALVPSVPEHLLPRCILRSIYGR